MTNTILLKKEIKRAGIKASTIMEALGIKSYATLRSKIKNESEFTAKEIMILCDLLRIDLKKREAIFFAKDAELHSA